MSDEPKAKFECVVSADLFRRALAAVGKEETRYYLNGVHVTPCEHGGVLLVATDGHRMIVLRDPEGVARNGTGIVHLNGDMIKALSAKSWKLPNWLGPITGKGTRRRFLAVRGDKAAVVEDALNKDEPIDYEALLAAADAPTHRVGAYQWVGAVIDGTYPNWRAVVGKPSPVPAPVAPIDPAILAPLAAALNGSAGMEHKGCRLVPTEGDADGASPIFVFSESQAAGFAIIMPTRGSGRASGLPDWIGPVTAMAAE